MYITVNLDEQDVLDKIPDQQLLNEIDDRGLDYHPEKPKTLYEKEALDICLEGYKSKTLTELREFFNGTN